MQLDAGRYSCLKYKTIGKTNWLALNAARRTVTVAHLRSTAARDASIHATTNSVVTQKTHAQAVVGEHSLAVQATAIEVIASLTELN